MPKIPFDRLPPDSRIWVFPSYRPLSQEEEVLVLETVDRFLEDWAAHGAPLTAARDWVHERFLVVGVDEASVPPSGCSIDAMVNVLKKLESELGTGFLNHAPVWYREEGGVRRATRDEFKELAEAGKVTQDTVVFDNSVTRKAQLDQGEWEKPAGASWHRQAFLKD